MCLCLCVQKSSNQCISDIATLISKTVCRSRATQGKFLDLFLQSKSSQKMQKCYFTNARNLQRPMHYQSPLNCHVQMNYNCNATITTNQTHNSRQNSGTKIAFICRLLYHLTNCIDIVHTQKKGRGGDVLLSNGNGKLDSLRMPQMAGYGSYIFVNVKYHSGLFFIKCVCLKNDCVL